ncbi:MAG: transcriptional regulator, CopG family [Acidobacteria bacterium]|nr:transcriptional regulator, CopG family [Acidobacteriota bacterium]
MARSTIAISVDENALAEVDRLVNAGVFSNRSEAIESAVIERLRRFQHSRLVREVAKLDIREEQAFADEGYVGEGGWPEY